MAIINTIKDNPWKTVFGSAGSIIAIVGALFSLDARYAHAEDVNREKLEIQSLLQDTSQTLRRQLLEDKLFELDVKRAQSPNRVLPPIDAALRERYQRQLDLVNATQTRNRSLNQSLPKD